jgi:hypothetical protein
MTTSTTSARISWWPSLLGLAAAIGIAFVGDVPAVILVCAAIYLLAAVVGSAGSAWIGFLASFPIIGLGIALRSPWLALAVIGAASVVLAVIGAVRGSWRSADGRRQLLAVPVFAAIAVTAAVLDAPFWFALIAAVGLIGHGAWDVWHHRRGAVVSRPYAEFCAVLDFALAAAVVASAILEVLT